MDEGAIAANVERARRLIGPDRKIYFVCKGDGFGFGAGWVASLAERAGVDALCAGSPEEAQNIRDAGVRLPILLFASTLPEQAAEVAALGVIVTIHSPESLAAYAALATPIDAFVEIDSGFGRFGFSRAQWHAAFERLSGQSSVKVRGIYSHLSSPDDAIVTAEQVATFNAALGDAAEFGFDDVERMLASSRVIINYPDLAYSAIDPGRLIYGALDGNYMKKGELRPLLKAVRARIIHVQTHQPGTKLGMGYGAPIEITSEVRLAVVPIGFWDGLNHVPPLGRVIVAGRYAPVIGRRSFQHSVIDVSDIPEANVGTSVTLLGESDGLEITIDELAETMKLPVMELIPRLARAVPRMR